MIIFPLSFFILVYSQLSSSGLPLSFVMFHKHQIFLLQCLCNLTSVNGAFTDVQADNAKSPSVIKSPYFGPSHIGLEFDWWLLGNHRSLEKNKWFLPVVVKSVAKTTRDWSLSPLQLPITWEKCVYSTWQMVACCHSVKLVIKQLSCSYFRYDQVASITQSLYVR